jgi:hypothetical protein
MLKLSLLLLLLQVQLTQRQEMKLTLSMLHQLHSVQFADDEEVLQQDRVKSDATVLSPDQWQC